MRDDACRTSTSDARTWIDCFSFVLWAHCAAYIHAHIPVLEVDVGQDTFERSVLLLVDEAFARMGDSSDVVTIQNDHIDGEPIVIRSTSSNDGQSNNYCRRVRFEIHVFCFVEVTWRERGYGFMCVDGLIY